MKFHDALKSTLSMGLIIALVSPSSALPLAAMTQIGVAGGVKGVVNAFPPGEKPVGRILASGQPLYLNEKISTGPKGSLQVMLIDETVFTIGPNSSMTLDEFIYDPKSHAGKVTARVTNGVFRFVTGQIGHKKPSDMTVKFPAGTMGIRGTIVAGQVSETGTTAVLLGPGPATNATEERVGAFSMENAGSRVDVVKPGYGTSINGLNSPPSAPSLVSQAQLSAILEAVSHGPQKSGTNEGAASAPASASADAGQSTAQAGDDLSDVQDIADLGTDLDNSTLVAANEIGDTSFEAFLAANQSSWDEVRTITNGNGYYSGTGDFVMSTCNPGPCAGTNGTTSLFLDIDFGLQTVGSANSKVIVMSNDVGVGAPINNTINFAATSFGALAGAATLSGTTAGTTANVSLLNIGGIAGSAVATVSHNAGGNIGSGAAGASLTCTSGLCH